MKYKKICKRLIAFILCTTISIQSFFSAEIPAYAGQATPSAMDSLEDLTENNYEELEIDLYDDTGTKLVPLSPDAIALLTYGNPDDKLNYLTDEEIEEEISKTPFPYIDLTTSLAAIVGCIIIGLIGLLSKGFCSVVGNRIKIYCYPSHSSKFETVDFKYVNSNGQVITSTITESMMESFGLKISSIENGTYWEPVLGLTDEDKLCLTYLLYMSKALVNLRRENIKIFEPTSTIKSVYPYYILQVDSSNNVKQICFDKKPIGSFQSNYASRDSHCYDLSGNVIDFKYSHVLFFSSYKIKYDNGVPKLLLELCNTYQVDYSLDTNTGLYVPSSSGVSYRFNEGLLVPEGAPFCTYSYPFNNYYLTTDNNKYISDSLLNLLTNDIDLEASGSNFVINRNRLESVSNFYESLPDVVELNIDSFVFDTVENLSSGKTTFLNPAGVATWDNADVRPTEVPTESVKPSESVQPSEGGGDSGTVTVTLTSILTKLSSLFDWVQNNLSPLAFATAVVSALGLTALFQTITTPLSSVLSHVSSIAGKVANIADWDINAWIGALAAPLAHLLDIDDMVSDIANWDIDALINAVPKFLNIDKTLSDIALSIAKWNFADWPVAMSQALRDVITNPMTALQTATDAIAKALDNVASWDVRTTLKALENAVTGALSGALTVAGIASLIEILTSIKDLIIEAIKPNAIDDTMDSNTDPSFFDLAKLLYILLAIIILLIILFLNCLRFIILIFSIPASTAFLNENIIMGIEFIKNLQVEKFNLSLYDLIVSVVYLLLFLAIIKAIRNKIDRIHL